MNSSQRPRLVERDGKTYIYDLLRRKYIVCTPEEQVRQQFIDYLTNTLGYPKSLISVEAGLHYNTRLKRTDIVVYSNQGKPFMLVECKRARVKLGREAIFQLATYNRELDADILVLTDGMEMICLQNDRQRNTLVDLQEVPAYK